MKFLSVLALYATANAAALSASDDTPTTFPNSTVDIYGYSCNTHLTSKFEDVPKHCVYHYVCNYYELETRKRCSWKGKAPKGVISYADLKKLPFGCKQQAICDLSKGKNSINNGFKYGDYWTDENEEKPYQESLSPMEEREREFAEEKKLRGPRTKIDASKIVGSRIPEWTFNGDEGKLPKKEPTKTLFVNYEDI